LDQIGALTSYISSIILSILVSLRSDYALKWDREIALTNGFYALSGVLKKDKESAANWFSSVGASHFFWKFSRFNDAEERQSATGFRGETV